MLSVERVENETERLAREVQERQDAEVTTTRGESTSQSCPVMEQSFMQFMQMVEDRRRRDQKIQNQFMHNLLSQAGQGRDHEGRGVSLSDFQNTRPLPFASAPEPGC